MLRRKSARRLNQAHHRIGDFFINDSLFAIVIPRRCSKTSGVFAGRENSQAGDLRFDGNYRRMRRLKDQGKIWGKASGRTNDEH